MTEEMLNPAKEAPQAIILSVYLGAVTGFIFLISAFFCIGDLEATALTPTGVPLIQIFYDSTKSVSGALTLSSMVTVIVIVCANSLMAEGSRALWAFSRDHGLPFSKTFARVNKRSQVPTNAILLCMVIQMGLNSIYFASYEGFSTVISIATFGFYISYAMPLFVRLWSYVDGSNPQAKQIPGAYSLGKWSPLVNGVGLLFLTFAAIDFNFPQVGPVSGDNMNYCSAAIGIIGVVSLVTWILDGRKNFTGPRAGVMNAVEPHQRTSSLGGDEIAAAEKTGSSAGDSDDVLPREKASINADKLA